MKLTNGLNETIRSNDSRDSKCSSKNSKKIEVELNKVKLKKPSFKLSKIKGSTRMALGFDEI